MKTTIEVDRELLKEILSIFIEDQSMIIEYFDNMKNHTSTVSSKLIKKAIELKKQLYEKVF